MILTLFYADGGKAATPVDSVASAQRVCRDERQPGRVTSGDQLLARIDACGRVLCDYRVRPPQPIAASEPCRCDGCIGLEVNS